MWVASPELYNGWGLWVQQSTNLSRPQMTIRSDFSARVETTTDPNMFGGKIHHILQQI